MKLNFDFLLAVLLIFFSISAGLLIYGFLHYNSSCIQDPLRYAANEYIKKTPAIGAFGTLTIIFPGSQSIIRFDQNKTWQENPALETVNKIKNFSLA